MKNTLLDLNNHLFEQLERLNDDDLKGDDLQEEIQRSKAMSGIAHTIISNASVVLEAHKFMDNKMDAENNVPRMLTGGEK